MNHLARRPGARYLVATLLLLSTQLASVANAAPAAANPSDEGWGSFCEQRVALCLDHADIYNYEGRYIGHDEPSLLFYSDVPGSGNNYSSTLILPQEPPVMPKPDGTGGTWNFQLHIAFWYGMALCDSQSAPEYTATCVPDTDANIYDGANPNARNYIGHHPGTAFMEMQFYPPGWVSWPPGTSCDATKWCAALTIDSLGLNQNTGQFNNEACLESVGAESVNFAFITTSGVAQAPANPLSFVTNPAVSTPDPTKDLFMSGGDKIGVRIFDTPAGLKVVLNDLTSGQSGSMTASPANGFGQVVFDPNASTCSVTPYAFHPMYATSGPRTRVPWAAHSYNVAFSDEIGHFEYCASVASDGTCAAATASDPGGADADDNTCYPAAQSLLVPIGGCLAESPLDNDYDGVSYGLNWPGTAGNPQTDRLLHPSPTTFTGLTFNRGQNYTRVAFETDLPAIEAAATPPCDVATGQDCVNPPPGAQFYPIYVTSTRGHQCVWQEGGPAIPGATNTFGGRSTTEYGSLFTLVYPTAGGPATIIEDFRRILSSNPCIAT